MRFLIEVIVDADSIEDVKESADELVNRDSTWCKKSCGLAAVIIKEDTNV